MRRDHLTYRGSDRAVPQNGQVLLDQAGHAEQVSCLHREAPVGKGSRSMLNPVSVFRNRETSYPSWPFFCEHFVLAFLHRRLRKKKKSQQPEFGSQATQRLTFSLSADSEKGKKLTSEMSYKYYHNRITFKSGFESVREQARVTI